MALWNWVVPELERTGLVTPADGLSIATMLRHYRAAAKAADQVGDEVMIPGDRAGSSKRNPALVVFSTQSTHFLEYAKSLGMTWMSRARTAAPKDAEGGERNPFESPAAQTG
jgi:P27 family predicted phage terminase small subunit